MHVRTVIDPLSQVQRCVHANEAFCAAHTRLESSTLGLKEIFMKIGLDGGDNFATIAETVEVGLPKLSHSVKEGYSIGVPEMFRDLRSHVACRVC